MGHGISPLAFALLFIPGWLVAGLLVSATSGWRELGSVYRHDEPPVSGSQWRGISGQMRGAMTYRNVLTITADPRGLWLSVMFLFRVGHPPLFIPWDDIAARRRKSWFSRVTVFDFVHMPGIRLELAERLGDEILQAAGR